MFVLRQPLVSSSRPMYSGQLLVWSQVSGPRSLNGSIQVAGGVIRYWYQMSGWYVACPNPSHQGDVDGPLKEPPLLLKVADLVWSTHPQGSSLIWRGEGDVWSHGYFKSGWRTNKFSLTNKYRQTSLCIRLHTPVTRRSASILEAD